MTEHKKPTEAQKYLWRVEAARTKRRHAEIRRQRDRLRRHRAQRTAGQQRFPFAGPANDR